MRKIFKKAQHFLQLLILLFWPAILVGFPLRILMIKKVINISILGAAIIIFLIQLAWFFFYAACKAAGDADEKLEEIFYKKLNNF